MGVRRSCGSGRCGSRATYREPNQQAALTPLRDGSSSVRNPGRTRPLDVFNSVATLHGVINTADGPYRVNGTFTEDHNIRDPGNPFIGTSGYAKIRGPKGVVFGSAKFQDPEGPPEFDLNFTSITACHLR